MKHTTILGALVAFGLLASACDLDESDDTNARSDAEESSSLACDHFRNVASDVRDGVLTDEELRTKLREVDDNASIATDEVQAAARKMLSAATQQRPRRLARAVEEMDAACRDAGH